MAYSSAGFEAAYYSFTDSSIGLPIGSSPTLANGSDSGFGQMQAAQELDFTTPEAPRVTILGDDKAYFDFIFQPQELASGSLTVGIFDSGIAANAIGLDVVDGGFPLAPSSVSYRDMWLVVNSQAKSSTLATFGNAGYEVTLFKVNLVPRFRDGWSNTTEATYTYDMISVPFSVYPWGASVTGVDTLGGLAGRFKTYKETYHTFIGDGATDSFTLDVAPAANNAATIKCYVYDVGAGTSTELTYNSSTPTTGEFGVTESGGIYTVTLGDGALTDGDFAIVQYGRI